MSDLEFQLLIEASLQRRLTGEETARVQDHLGRNPEARELWEEETGLTRLLGGLSDVPVSSNFSAQVLRGLDSDVPAERRPSRIFGWLSLIRPGRRAAWACAVVLLFAGAGYRQYHLAARARMAASVTSVAKSVESAASLAQLPSVELWQDFDSISRLPVSRADRAVAGADEELLAALK